MPSEAELPLAEAQRVEASLPLGLQHVRSFDLILHRKLKEQRSG